MARFTILHLSDAHIGNPKLTQDSREVLGPLLKDLERMRSERELVPDLVVFSGDLAFGEVAQSSLASQYDRAKQWVEDVYTALAVRPEAAPLMIVPGNHDVNRYAAGDDQDHWLDWLKHQSNDPVSELEKQMSSSSVLWRRMLERLAEWHSFAQKALPKGWVLDSNLMMSLGEFCIGSVKVGIAGLNTSWACSGTKDQGRLWIGRHQAQRAWQALEKCDFKIVVSHHPVGWLHASEQNYMHEKLVAQFDLHLHGHVHSEGSNLIDNRHLCISAGPCYEHSDKKNAYSWVVVDFEKSCTDIHFRGYSDKGSGGWVPNFIPAKTNSDGVQVLENFPALQSTSMPSATKQSSPLRGPQLKDIVGLPSLIEALQEYFSLRWEPGRFARPNDSPAIVYWPVRLRPPTPIHATQAFIAAALQKKGAEIVLYLDDLGNTDGGTVEKFKEVISRWLARVNVAASKFRIELFSQLLADDREATWEMVRKWLTGDQYRLDRVLEVSKITTSGESVTLEELLQRRPRRLLTPPLVWACLARLLSQNANHSVITLGGFDEQALWRTWRESVANAATAVGHLYAPVLRKPTPALSGTAVHMAKRRLAWDSREDIQEALEEDRIEASEWLAKGRMAEWCLRGAVLLPLFVAGGTVEWRIDNRSVTPSSDFKELAGCDPHFLARELSKCVAQWVL